jgi:hypothetical protein
MTDSLALSLTATPAVFQLNKSSSRSTNNSRKKPAAAGFFLRSQFLLFAILTGAEGSGYKQLWRVA